MSYIRYHLFLGDEPRRDDCRADSGGHTLYSAPLRKESFTKTVWDFLKVSFYQNKRKIINLYERMRCKMPWVK
jgi:hypothetical protein